MTTSTVDPVRNVAAAGRLCPVVPVYRIVHDDVFIDAVPIRFDMADFLGRFLPRWLPDQPRTCPISSV
jgi:hypothetical protein